MGAAVSASRASTPSTATATAIPSKGRTLRGYKETLVLAGLEFGDTWLRELGQAELSGFYARIEGQKPGSASE